MSKSNSKNSTLNKRNSDFFKMGWVEVPDSKDEVFKERERLSSSEAGRMLSDMPSDVVLASRLRRIESGQQQIRTEFEASQEEYKNIQASLAKTTKSARVQSEQLKANAAQLQQMDSQVKNEKLQAIQVLALFVAFFTFVSVEFQFFANVKDSLMIIALTGILLGGLLLFVCLTFLGLAYYHTLDPKENGGAVRFNKRFLYAIAGMSVILLGVGVWMSFVSQNRKLAECRGLETSIMQELKKDDSKVEDFLRQSYDLNCKETND